MNETGKHTSVKIAADHRVCEKEHHHKRSTQVNRLSDDRFVVVVPIHFGNYISSPTNIHYASDSEFEVAIFRSGFGESLACRVSAAKNNFLSFCKSDGSRDLIRADFAEEIFPLLKY